MLLTLPEPSRQDYFHLLADPLLMLEQLLMNLKVDWVSVAVSTLRNLLPAQEAGIADLNIDTLLAEYAKKALDFPYAPLERTRSGEGQSFPDMIYNSLINHKYVPLSPNYATIQPSMHPDFMKVLNLLLEDVWAHGIFIYLFFLFAFVDSVISLQDSLLQCPIQESASSSPSRTPPPSAGMPYLSIYLFLIGY